MTIRKVLKSEIDDIRKVYLRAQQYMKDTGNPEQWQDRDLSRELLLSDIEKGNLYAIEEDGEILGAFAFIHGVDPTYNYIEGSWLDDLPYCAVHRVASAGKRGGIFKIIMDYVFTQTDCIKIDTHDDNLIMQHQLEKYGFTHCGTIYLADGRPRIAYQLRKK